jgi:hypothetical protein
MPLITTTQLTQKIVDATPIPKSGFVTLRDHVERGLICRIWHTGAKKWALEFRSPVTGKNARLGLPADSLATARAAAKQLRAQIAAGRDPGLETKQEIHARKEALTKALTVLDALGLYPCRHGSERRQGTLPTRQVRQSEPHPRAVPQYASRRLETRHPHFKT